MSESEKSTASQPGAAESSGPPPQHPPAPPLVLPDEAKDPKDLWLWGAVIAILCLLAYGPAIRGGYVWDDDRYVTANPALRTAEGLGDIWTRIGTTPQYYPLTHTTFWIEYQIWGAGPDSALGYHIVNVLLHCGSAVALWFILRRLKVPGAWVIAAIFALHPINVESAAWITERKNVLSGLFFFLSILAYLHAGLIDRSDAREPSADGATLAKGEIDWSMYALAFICFIAGLLSKTAISPLPAVLIVIIWWKRGRIGWSDVAPLVPFFVFGIAFSMLTGWMERNTVGANGPEWNLSVAQRLVVAGRAIWFYVGKILLPRNLTFSYPRWDVAPSDPTQWIGLIAAIVVTVALLAARKKIGRGFLAAWLIFVGMLVPALGFVNVYPMKFSFVADHFAYLASVGMIIIVVEFVAAALRQMSAAPSGGPDSAQGARSPLAAWICGIALAVLLILTYRQATAYASDEALWRDTLAKNEKSWLAAYNLGLALQADGSRLEQTDPESAYKKENNAIEMFKRAVELKPDYALAWRGWGDMLLNEGDLNHTVSRQAEAFDISTRRAAILRAAATRGTTRASTAPSATSMPTTSLATTRPADLITPEVAAELNAATRPATYPTTASIYADKSRAKFEEALQKYNESLKYDDSVPFTHNNKGLALVRLDRIQEAIAEYQRAIAQYKKIIEDSRAKFGSYSRLSQPHPRYATFHLNLAEALKSLGKENWDEAIAEYKNAIKINPNLIDARRELGLLLARMGGHDREAFLTLADVRQARPDDAEIPVYLGNLAAAAGKYELAGQLFYESLQKQPDNPRAIEGLQRLNEVIKQIRATTQRAATQRSTTQPSASNAASTQPISPPTQ